MFSHQFQRWALSYQLAKHRTVQTSSTQRDGKGQEMGKLEQESYTEQERVRQDATPSVWSSSDPESFVAAEGCRNQENWGDNMGED